MNIADFLDLKRVLLDKNGIYVSELPLTAEAENSLSVWGKIYDFDLKKLEEDRRDFIENKLADHMMYIERSYQFSSMTLYLEIGCGPAYIGEYLMKQHNVFFIGIDFNYPILVSLKNYFNQQGFTQYVLVHADINDIPMKEGVVDYIYGGGVIEHFKNTDQIVKKLYMLLKKGGICFNTVPAFNVMWLVRFYNNIPSVPILKNFLGWLHVSLLHYKLLNKYHGYELSYTTSSLLKMHRRAGFEEIKINPFAFHPSMKRLHNHFLRSLYYAISSMRGLNPVHYIAATK